MNYDKKEIIEVLREINEDSGGIAQSPSFVKNGHIALKTAIETLDKRTVDADKLIKKLDNRIDEFIKKQPEQKDCEAVEMVREVIQMLDRKVDGEEERRK